MATNTVRGERRLELVGQTYVLCPTFSRIAAAEDVLGRSVLQAVMEVQQGRPLRMTELASLVAVLSRDPQDPSPDVVGTQVVRTGVIPVTNAVVRCLTAAISGPDAGDEGKPEPPSDE